MIDMVVIESILIQLESIWIQLRVGRVPMRNEATVFEYKKRAGWSVILQRAWHRPELLRSPFPRSYRWG